MKKGLKPFHFICFVFFEFYNNNNNNNNNNNSNNNNSIYDFKLNSNDM